MQPVNDDMDNLFRRAAEDYPLNTNGADFDKVRQRVDAETMMPEKKESKRRYLWLLLLLLVPMPLLLKYYPIPHYSQNKKEYQVAQQENQENIPAITTSDTSHSITEKERVQAYNNKKSEPVNNASNQLSKQYPKTVEIKTQDNNTVFNRPINSTANQPVEKNKSRVSATQIARSSAAVISKKDKTNLSGNESVFLSSGTKKLNNKSADLLEKKDSEKVIKKLVNAKNMDVVNQTGTNTGNKPVDSVLQTVVSKKSTDSSAVSKANKTNDSAGNEAGKKIVTKNKNTKKPAIYIGIAAGSDYSVVKSNKSNGPGYNIGFIAGYHTGRHLAFETGILWNYKKYYSDGKNISLDKLALPSHTEVVYLDGTCGIIEIPVSIRYYFNSKGKQNLYAGAGISSYIIKKESYDYLYKRYNMQYYSEKEYKNSSTNWLSVLQLSIGYQVNLKKAGSLRLEPYAKFPLKGLGIGKLPISGGGINIGFTMPVY